MASMEPLFFKAENASVWAKAASGLSSFNGAAFFQSGKSECCALSRSARPVPASMEPLFFKAENRSPSRCPGASPGCFNGAAFFQSGKCYHVGASPARRRLQWSRFFSKRKIPMLIRPFPNRAYCFNGAAFFQSGKYLCTQVNTLYYEVLQRSRFFSKRKMRSPLERTVSEISLQWSRFFSKRKIKETAQSLL